VQPPSPSIHKSKFVTYNRKSTVIRRRQTIRKIEKSAVLIMAEAEAEAA